MTETPRANGVFFYLSFFIVILNECEGSIHMVMLNSFQHLVFSHKIPKQVRNDSRGNKRGDFCSLRSSLVPRDRLTVSPAARLAPQNNGKRGKINVILAYANIQGVPVDWEIIPISLINKKFILYIDKHTKKSYNLFAMTKNVNFFGFNFASLWFLFNPKESFLL